LKQPKKLKRLRRKLAKENVINHQAVVVAVVFLVVVVIAIVIAIVIVVAVAVAVVVVLSRCWEKIKSHKSNKSYETKVTPATARKGARSLFPLFYLPRLHLLKNRYTL